MSENPVNDQSTVLHVVDTRITSIVREVIRDGHNPKIIVEREKRFTRDGLPAATTAPSKSMDLPPQKES